MKRLEPLDWLRGILAISIMIYHLTHWVLLATPDSGTLLGRMGIYGVSMFFVLSGLSMAFVYNSVITDFYSSIKFLIRRLFRILPLLWVAIIALIIGNAITGRQQPAIDTILLNLTTLFGFIRPSDYINTGAWSIGNEMVYYSLTPFLIMIFNHKVLYGNIIFLLSILIGVFFATTISPSETLASQWDLYINPFNNFFLYCSGIAIYYNLSKEYTSWKISLITIIPATLIFMIFPIAGDLVNIVTGISRVTFSTASILLVIGFYKMPIFLPRFTSYTLEKIGIITYGIYLLHPIAYKIIEIIFSKLHYNNSAPLIKIIMISILTLFMAQIIYLFIEKPFIKMGKRITSKIKSSPNPRMENNITFLNKEKNKRIIP